MTTTSQQEMVNRIKIYMLKNHITQKELAKKLKIKAAAVSKFLDEKSNMRASTINKISKALGVPVNYFFASSDTNIIGDNNFSTVGNIEIEISTQENTHRDSLPTSVESLGEILYDTRFRQIRYTRIASYSQ